MARPMPMPGVMGGYCEPFALGVIGDSAACSQFVVEVGIVMLTGGLVFAAAMFFSTVSFNLAR